VLLSISVAGVILVIRFIGVLNAAIWLGAAVFVTFAAAPAFFTGEAKYLETAGMHPFYAGAMAEVVLARYFYVQYICGAIALAHLLAEWVYLGRALQRFTLSVLVGLLCLGFAGGLWLQPRLKRLHLTRYSMSESLKPVAIPDAERVQAGRTFRVWHRVSALANLGALGGLVFYFWRVTHPPDNLRFVSTSTKFRS
jgi:Domain of unknown function (DUF4149)